MNQINLSLIVLEFLRELLSSPIITYLIKWRISRTWKTFFLLEILGLFNITNFEIIVISKRKVI